MALFSFLHRRAALPAALDGRKSTAERAALGQPNLAGGFRWLGLAAWRFGRERVEDALCDRSRVLHARVDRDPAVAVACEEDTGVARDAGVEARQPVEVPHGVLRDPVRVAEDADEFGRRA